MQALGHFKLASSDKLFGFREESPRNLSKIALKYRISRMQWNAQWIILYDTLPSGGGVEPCSEVPKWCKKWNHFEVRNIIFQVPGQPIGHVICGKV